MGFKSCVCELVHKTFRQFIDTGNKELEKWDFGHNIEEILWLDVRMVKLKIVQPYLGGLQDFRIRLWLYHKEFSYWEIFFNVGFKWRRVFNCKILRFCDNGFWVFSRVFIQIVLPIYRSIDYMIEFLGKGIKTMITEFKCRIYIYIDEFHLRKFCNDNKHDIFYKPETASPSNPDARTPELYGKREVNPGPRVCPPSSRSEWSNYFVDGRASISCRYNIKF